MPFDGNAILQLLDMAADVRDQIAQEIIDGTSPPKDTGFLDASAYIMSDRTNTFDGTWETGQYTSTKTGLDAYRERVPEPEMPPDSNTCIIGWAAIYAWYVEDKTNFIFGGLMNRAEGGVAAEGSGGDSGGSNGSSSSGGGWWQSTKQAASSAASSAWGATKSAASGAWNATKSAASSAWSAVTGLFRR